MNQSVGRKWSLLLLLLSWPGLTRCQELLPSMAAVDSLRLPLAAEAVDSAPEPLPSRSGSIAGMVLDASEAAVPGAVITLVGNAGGDAMRVTSGDDGAFLLPGVPNGVYRLRVERQGFVPFTSDPVVTQGRLVETGEILLGVAAADSVEVHASSREIAEAQVELEERQRVLGIFPNFYASYAPDAEPLSAAQKFHMAWRFSADPVAFAMTGLVAGVQQSSGSLQGYGGGMRGYDRRFGASYTDGLSSTLLGQALFPAIFHQDPRYFVKGTGNIPARTLYALASTVMCKGDNKRWQVNYSNLLGNAASAELSNVYYPKASRLGVGSTVQGALTTTALGAIGGLFQEFFLHRMTPHVPEYEPTR